MHKIILSICFILLITANATHGEDSLALDLFSGAKAVVTKVHSDSKPTIRSRIATVNSVLLQKFTQGDVAQEYLINLNLFENVDLKARIQLGEKTLSKRYSLTGTVEQKPESQVVFILHGGNLSGSISVPGHLYQVRSIGNGQHKINEVDQALFPPELPPVRPVHAVKTQKIAFADDADPSPFIDILVVYTEAAGTSVGGSTEMEALIDLAVLESNIGYSNSDVNQRLRLINTQEVNYNETGFNWETTLDRLGNTSDGHMDEIHALRDNCGADTVLLIVDDTVYCGLAYVMQTQTVGFAPYAFSIVSRNCVTGIYSFAHELGHNMGSVHDRENADDPGAFPYSYGFQAPDEAFRTIMSYDCPSGCPRVNYWSNPDVQYGHQPMGIEQTDDLAADNRLSLNNTAGVVSGFRASDSEFPVIIDCPSDISVPLAIGSCSENISWTEPTASDNCCLADFSSSHNPGGTFYGGTTQVTYTAVDTAGNETICGFSVALTEDEDPEISNCPSDITAVAQTGACGVVSWTAPEVSDNCTVASFISSHDPGDTLPGGTTQVTYTATDYSGNTDICSFNVTVNLLAELNISMEADNPAPILGDVVVFTITVTNSGPCSTSGVKAINILPDGLEYQSHNQGQYGPESGVWDIGGLDAGDSIFIEVLTVARIKGEIINSAMITQSDVTDSSSGNDTADVTIDVKEVGIGGGGSSCFIGSVDWLDWLGWLD